MEPSTQPEKRRKLDRVTAACDLCKARKVKCDGQQPCSYCQRKDRADTCTFSAPRVRGAVTAQSAGNTPANGSRPGDTDISPRRERTRSDPTVTKRFQADATQDGHSVSPTVSREDHHEDTAVPLEARLLRDAQGKVIFIGDCAPLSFLQTVRHLIASEVDPDGLPLQVARDSVIEYGAHQQLQNISVLGSDDIASLVSGYLVATSGLADLFDRDRLFEDVKEWANGSFAHDSSSSAVFYLVAAIGVQEDDSSKAEAWFAHAKETLQTNLSSSMNLASVRGFALVAIYLLRAFQPNGAYLYFSLAARTAYAIGLHRTEVNASFGAPIHTIRDRIWKSLRVVDMLISNLLGRPPSTSDVDCTVRYSTSEVPHDLIAPPQVLDASVQIFMIIERVVVEVYSRKRISLRIANFVSHQLKGWASLWLKGLTGITSSSATSQEILVGACQTLCSYFYGIMLLTRPFLIYELYEHLGASLRTPGTRAENQEKRKFADAALDAAVAFVEMLRVVIATRKMPARMPLVVSWLFTAALVLAVGVLGRSGMSFEEPCQEAIQCLDYFGKVDPHAQQYSFITSALLKTTKEHVEKREDHLRSQRKAASSQLFGMLSCLDGGIEQDGNVEVSAAPTTSIAADPDHSSSIPAPTDWTYYDADFFALPWLNENDQGLQDFLQPGRHHGSLADIPLFPMYDQMEGHAPHGLG